MSIICSWLCRSQELFRQAMSSSKVRLEVLPSYNKLRYEKSLIGQLFNNTDPNLAVPKPRSPFLVRKLGSATTPSPEPPFSQTPPLKEEGPPLARNTLAEMRKDTPSPTVSVSPTLKDRSESPAPKKTTALATLGNTINKKSGKIMKIDLKKGKFECESRIQKQIKWSTLFKIRSCFNLIYCPVKLNKDCVYLVVMLALSRKG